ncbi:GIY-YIG nuclease family protein [Microbacterium sp. Nx66]|uniref:GIY-YIG nuclease family protein n=1 Tax=Microbacterium sp. Nx66 TaxID=2766784 RepID=UPI0016573BD0|nr:GIY-YIG nuclease family protein [Microbacterium sp. Nx66]CAD5140705.1 GIY-YIG nuclease family protein [Microbacterium sp. Nx66]
MSLTLGTVLDSESLPIQDVLVIRHAYNAEPTSSRLAGVHAGSTDDEILAYTRRQSAKSQIFPVTPPRVWVVLVPEGGDRGRLWRVVENRGEISNDGELREFDLAETDHLRDLLGRLVIGWKAGRVWRVYGATAATYPVLEVADAQPPRFPGFDRLIVSYEMLKAVVKERRYAAWQTALSSIVGIYLITDTRDGRHYVGKADGAENILQRWRTYAANGHGGNVALRERDPSTFRYSLLRVFDPSTPLRDINAAESHFKRALDSITHGLNRG